MKNFYKLITLLLFITLSTNLMATTIYVDASKTDDTGNGLSWATAKQSLQIALGLAVSGDQIWVKAGTYKPGNLRNNCFGLRSGVSVYGGFAGTETSVSERVIFTNETILSREIGAATNTDNCYIVVLSNSISNALLDGFTIKNGYMNGPSPVSQWQKDGGGIHHSSSQVTYNNLKIIQNYAEWNGSGVFVTGSGLASFNNCLVADNIWSPGFTVYQGTSTLNNCTFTNNSFYEITVIASGYSNTFNNCIVWGGTENININSGTVNLNNCDYQSCGNSGSFNAINCITSDPKFVNAASGDYKLCGNSPCVDAGNDSYNSLLTDIRGFDFGRKLLKTNHSSTGIIDIGAYEYKEGTDQLADIVAPTTQASNLVFSSVQATQMTIGWTNGNGTSRAVFVKAANTGTATPIDNTTYTANTTFLSGTQICSTGWYCVYNGTGTSITLTGLNAGTDYIVQVFEYFGASGSETYNPVTATENPKSQTTVGRPTVTTQAVIIISDITATGKGNITDLGVSNPTQYGVVWSTSTNPTVALLTKTTQGAIDATGAFASSITGLTANTTYYVKAYATNSLGTGYGEEVSFSTLPVAPTVTTQAVSSIAATTATGNGNITDLGVPNPTQYGVVWSTATNPTVSLTTKTTEGAIAATGAFTSSITGLAANTTYYVKAYATNTAGTSYGTEVSFTTLPVAPTVTTQAVSSITTTTATGNGNITSLGVPNPTEYGVVWSTSSNPTVALLTKTTQGAIAAIGAFTSSITGLAANTTYYVKAYATNSVGTGYGTEVYFTTLPVAPTVTTQAVSSIAATTATGNGNITNLGVPNPTQYGVVWSTSTNPTAALSTKTTQGAASSTGAFTSSITGLAPNTTYYVKAYATNTAGISYGAQVQFKTLCSDAITVITNANSGAGSLRQAITDICDGGTITFNLSAGNETITIAEALFISGKSLTIEGTNSAGSGVDVTVQVTTPGTSTWRAFYISNSAGKTIAVQNMTIKGGKINGGGGALAIVNGSLNLTNVTISDSKAMWGGALLSRTPETVTISSSTITNNELYSAIVNQGGGIYISNGFLIINNSSITNNRVPIGWGGGIGMEGGTLTVNNSIIADNVVTNGSGGGIGMESGTLTINNSIIKNNSANADGGAIWNNTNGQLTVNSSTINGNTAQNGGGIYNNSTMNVISSTISGNTSSLTTGGVYQLSGNSYLLNTIIINNTASANYDITIAGGNSYAYFSWYDLAKISGSISTQATAPNLTTAYNSSTGLENLALNAPGTTETMATKPGCPAIYAGTFAYYNTTDKFYFMGSDASSHKLTDWGTNPTIAPSDKINTDQRDAIRGEPSTIGAYNTCIVPSISSQSTATQTQCLNGTFTAITVTATGDGLIYQWYSNTTASTSSGITVGSNSNSYTPSTAIVGMLYYYCVVSGSCGTATSEVSEAFIVNSLPAAMDLTGSTICASPGNNGTITSTTSVSGVSYQLYNSSNATVQTGKSGIGSALTWSALPAGTGYYVTGTNASTSCTSTSNTAEVAASEPPTTANAGIDQTQCNNGSFTLVGNNPSSGTGEWSVTSGTATVTTASAYNSGVTGVPVGTSATLTWTISNIPCNSSTDDIVLTNNAPTAIGSASLTTQTQCLNGTFSPITVTATGTGTLAYQWYSNTSASTSGGTTVGTNSNSYTPSAAVAGTLYYYCVVTGTCETATSDVSGAFVTLEAGGNITVSNGVSSPYGWSVVSGVLTACADVTINVGVINTALVTGNLTVQATNKITIDAAIAPDLTAARTLTLKAGGNISMLASSSIAPATEFALNTIFWSDLDATNGGAVVINNDASITTKGGHLWIGGGSVTTTWNTLSVGNGYALGNSAQLMGIYISKATLNTSGGNLAMYGKSHSSTGTGSPIGIAIGTDATATGGSTISTDAGSIYLNGVSQLGSGGIETGYNGGTSSLQSTTGNINFVGVSAQGSGIALKSVFTVASTSGGNITLTGTSSGTNQNGIYMENAVKVLASGGTITLTGTGTGTGKDVNLVLAGGAAPVIGYAASSVVTASTSNITINANTLSLHSSSRLQSSGILTIQPRTWNDIGVGGAGGTLQLPSTYFNTNFTDGFNKIIIGSTGTSYINISGTTTYNDDLTLKCAVSIFFAEFVNASLTSSGSDLTLWSRSGGNNDPGVDGYEGCVWLPSGSNVNTGGGDVVIGGGSDPTIGFCYGDNASGSNESNARYRGVSMNGTLNAGGGNISIRGKGNTQVSATRGVSTDGSVSTSGTGTIYIYGIAKGTSDGLGLSTLTSGTGAVTLSGSVWSGNNGVNIYGSINCGGNLNVGASGAIIASSALNVAGTSSFSASTWINIYNTNNDFTGNVSVADGDAVTIVDKNALSLGAINISGLLNAQALSGNLSINNNIATSNTSTAAIKLYADYNKIAGDATGGNIIVNGTPAITTGTGGRAMLYTGSISGSSGLSGIVSSSYRRYNSDKNTVTFTPATPALGSGLYGIYREKTAITSQLTDAQTQCLGGTFTPITVTATGVDLTYQWYSNVSASNSGGTSLNSDNDAQTSSYTPQSVTAGSLYYYCVVSGTSGTATSAVSGAFVTNCAPTDITLSANSINENVASNSTFGALNTTDPDAGNTFTYTLVAGTGSTDNASFNISGNSLRITNSPDFETKNSYLVRIRTTDQGGLFFEKSFTITINDVNETPTYIALSASAIDENVAENSSVGTFSTTDPDATNTFAYTLVAGTGSTDNASFNISGNSLRITNSPDFETKNSYSVRVRTTDQSGVLYFEKAFTITINDLNETPATQASNISFASVANIQMGISWSIGSGTSRAVFVKQASSGTASPVDGTTYSANTTFGGGSQIGSSEWYCIYNGTGSTVTLSGLTLNTAYQVHVCEYNGSAGSEAYNTTSATNNPKSQTTTMPTISTTSNFSAFTACSGSVSTAQSFTVSGTNLNNNITISAPAGFEVSTSISSSYAGSVSLTQSGGSVSATTVYVRLTNLAIGTPSGNVSLTSTNATTQNLAVSGTVNPVTVIASQSTDAQTQCLNGIFTTISVNATGTVTLTYQWYSNTTATTSGGTQIGSNSNSYTPLATTAGTLYYYCVVTGSCGTATTAVSGAFVVHPTSLGGSVTGASPITYGSSSGIMILESYTGTIQYWQRKLNSGTWEDVANTNATYSEYPNEAGTWYYRAVVKSGNCNEAYSNSFALTVNKATLTVTANNQTKAVGNTFTFTGNEFATIGLVYSDAVSSVTLTCAGAVSGALADLYDIVPSAATGSGLSNYNIDYVNGIMIVGTSWTGNISTIWNIAGNWSNNQIPDIGSDIIIPSSATNQPHVTNSTSNPAICKSINIASNAVLTIDAGKALSVNSTIAIQGSQGLVVKSDASLINNGTITGTAKVERLVTGDKWHLLSSPITNATANLVTPAQTGTTTPVYLRQYNESTNAWSYIYDVTTSLNPAKGYAIWADLTAGGATNPTITYTGTLNANTTIPYANSNSGWNLLGNPYTSALDWNAVTGKASLAGGAFYCWNSTSGKYSVSDGYAAVNLLNIVSPYIIPAMQGFFVKATTGGSLGISAAKIHSAQSFYKNSNSLNDMVRLTAQRGTFKDEALVVMNSSATNNYDEAYDASKFFANNTDIPEIYTLAGSEKIAINKIGSFPAVVPVNIRMGVADNVTITASDYSNFDASVYIILEDVLNGTFQNLRQNPSYTFAASVGENAGRFNLHFSYIALGIDELQNKNANIYSSNNTIYVNSSEKINDISVYNMLGQLIVNKAGNSNALNTITVQAANAYYIVKVTTVNGVYTEKVYVK